MIKYLIQRPVAVLLSFTALLAAGIFLSKQVPVSLLPDVDVPEIVVRVNYPNTAATVMEKNIIRPIREGLVNLDHLQQIESRAANHTGLIRLRFNYGTRMKLSYIEVNEKLDRLSSLLPRDMPRPQVMRVNTSDIPVIRLQVIPREGTPLRDVSMLAERILKKRIEQVNGVSLVDINGSQGSLISITPDRAAMTALGIDENQLVAAVQQANNEPGGLNIKDGQYRYFVRMQHTLVDAAAIDKLPVRLKDGSVVLLNRFASVQQEPEQQTGFHLYNGREGLVITIQKQPDSRMNELVPAIKKTVEQFKKEYPQVEFALTQDQTFLLDAGISNLKQDLLYGGILTILLLFMFLGNWASPTLMSISIPLSLIITFIFFYLFRISFNIISLSGLALGVGMLIDNSIVVIDSITRKRKEGMEIMQGCVEGTNEVMAPVISQVLTTVAVYAPLVLLSGMAGSLVTDQALGLTISLGVSLLVAFVLVPLLYRLFLKSQGRTRHDHTRFYRFVSRGYHRMISHILRHKLVYFIATLLIMPVGIWLASVIPVSALPRIEKKESLVYIDWNDPVDAHENLRRTKALLTVIQPYCTVTESEAGLKQFLLQQDNNTIQRSEIYFSCDRESRKIQADEKIRQWMRQQFPRAGIGIIDAPNAFTQLFSSATPFIEIKFKPQGRSSGWNEEDALASLLNQFPVKTYEPGPGLMNERNIMLTLNDEKMAVYGISRESVDEALKQQFGSYPVSEIRRYGEIKTIRLNAENKELESKLASTVSSSTGAHYPLGYFLGVSNERQLKFITADQAGEYKSVLLPDTLSNVPAQLKKITALAAKHGYGVEFAGQYFENRKQLRQLWLIFLLVMCLLYIILAMQYENLVQPLVVMLTIPLGISGGMFFLWLTGGTLDVMAAIGFIVILGLIVDDPILKIETLNRLEKKYAAAGLPHDNQLLERMIHEAGDRCLKPLLMVSLTTSIALVPVLFVGGIGNDLQKPLAVVIIGGLTIGTFFTTWFTPLAYWYVTKWKLKFKKNST